MYTKNISFRKKDIVHCLTVHDPFYYVHIKKLVENDYMHMEQ